MTMRGKIAALEDGRSLRLKFAALEVFKGFSPIFQPFRAIFKGFSPNFQPFRAI